MTQAKLTAVDAPDASPAETTMAGAEHPAHSPVEGAIGTVQLLEETPHVSRRQVVRGMVRVSTRTAVRDESVEVGLEFTVVDAERVPVNRPVDSAPQVRTERDVTVVPVLEERVTVVKQPYLVEELRIRHRVETVVEDVPVQLRRQAATVERVDALRHAMDDPERSS